MKVYNFISKLDNDKRSVTIGTFDGIHKGHSILINKTVEIAKKNNVKSTVITFNQLSIDNLLKKNYSFLISPDEKMNILDKMSVEEVFNLNFNKKIMSTKCNDFLLRLKKKINLQFLILGFDARLGSDQKNVNEIKKFCELNSIELIIIPELSIDNEKVSSTKIRNMIRCGIVGDELIKNLGRPYKITGKIVYGDNLGKKTFGFPTANIESDIKYVYPKKGVYYCKIRLNDIETYDCAVNIGNKPTITNKKKSFSIEANIFNFNKNIYGECVELTFISFIREEKKFKSYEDLKQQINEDVKKIRKYINKNI